MTEFKASSEIESALIKFNGAPITAEQLAQHVGFDDESMRHLSLFRPAVFNKSWIHLDRDLIKEWFCKDDVGKNAVNNFANRVLSKYIEGTDYREATQSEIEAASACSSKVRSKDQHGGSNAKQYMVTGECFKMIGMERNRSIRQYYVRVEELFGKMVEYMMACQLHTANARIADKTREAEEAQKRADDERVAREAADAEAVAQREAAKKKDDELATCHAVIASANAVNARWVAESADVSVPAMAEVIYIASSPSLQLRNRFKVGGVKDDAGVKPRLANYNSSHATDDPFEMLYTINCHSYLAVEDLFWRVAGRYRDKQDSKKEMIHLRFDTIRLILDSIVAGTASALLAFTPEMYREWQRATIEDSVEVQRPTGPTIQQSTTSSTAGSSADPRIVAQLIEAIEVYLKIKDPTYVFAEHRDSRDAVLIWAHFSPTLGGKFGKKTKLELRGLVKALIVGSRIKFAM